MLPCSAQENRVEDPRVISSIFEREAQPTNVEVAGEAQCHTAWNPSGADSIDRRMSFF